MASLDDVAQYLADEHGLAVISTTQSDGRILSSVINCGVTEHPLTGEPCIGLVSRGDAMRLTHIKRGSQVTVAVRRGWQWLSVTGSADIIGPGDSAGGMDADRLSVLLREVFKAAGGEHDDWNEYDRVMIEDRRAAVFVANDRVLGNP